MTQALRQGSIAIGAARRPGQWAPRARRLAVWPIAGLAMAVAPLVFSSGLSISMMSQMGIAIIFALSYNMLLGQSGMLSFGHAVFFGLGGFMAIHGLVAVNDGWLAFPVSLLPVIGGLTGLFFGIVFGYLATRRTGTSFAMITLGIGEMVAASSLILVGFFGGEEGVAGDRVTGTGWFGVSFSPQIEVYYLIALWTLIAVAAMSLLTQTPLGRLANAVRDNPERVEFLGYDRNHIRFLQFALSGLFAGIGGGLFAINYEIVTAEAVSLESSANVLVMAYVGGIGHFAGPILGAIVITFLDLVLSDYTEAWLLYLGIFFIVMVMFAPGGIAGLIALHAPVWRARRITLLLPAYALAVGPALLAVLGAMLLIEINYFVSTRADAAAPLTFLWISFDPTSPLAWLVGVGLFAGGVASLRRVMPVVAKAWVEVGQHLQKEPGR